MSCSCGCVTNGELDELRKRLERLLDVLGLEETVCGGPLKPCNEHAPIVNSRCKKCETWRQTCLPGCERGCQGIGTVLTPKKP